jgi:Fe-S cluster biogenesis protein NfuA
MFSQRLLLPFFLSCYGLLVSGFTTTSPKNSLHLVQNQFSTSSTKTPSQLGATQDDTSATSPAPVLNGKRVLPFKILMAGLKGNKVAGTYAVLNSEFKRGSEGWKCCQHVGVSMDLETTLNEHVAKYSSDRVAHVRALTFVVPSRGAMEEIADQWKALGTQEGGHVHFDPVLAALEEAVPYDDDEDDDEEWDEEDDQIFEEMQMAANAMSRAREEPEPAVAATEKEQPAVSSSAEIVSPFDESKESTNIATAHAPKEFTKEAVDKVLEEVRPYLISDGGNVSVQNVDVATKSVYLKLEGACGSCPSSTVTMKMGIERVLKENFPDLGEIIQIEDDEEDKPTELTYQVVENEVNRIKPAILAMGGVVNIKSVDPIGVVELEFRGANKVRQGLELAILDIGFVKHVKFVSQDE